MIAGAGLGAAAAVALRRRWSGGDQDDAISQTPLPPVDLTPAGEAFLDHLVEAVWIPTVAYEDTTRVNLDRFADFRRFLEMTYPLTYQHLELELVAEHSLLQRAGSIR